jgi:hypothetical protein
VAYIAPRDFGQDPELVARLMKTFAGQLELEWMKSIRERLAARPSQARRGLTLGDINQGGYSPDLSPEIVRHNFSMAPRGAILPKGLPSLGYRLNRKSEVWSDLAAQIFEEGKARRWAPARDVPWEALGGARYTPEQRAALRQLATSLQSIGLVAADVAAKWEWTMNQEFHEVKYLMCLQMIDAARIAEAFRKRALYGEGSLGADFRELGELLKIVFESGTYPCASASLNLVVFGLVQALGRHLEWASDNAADGVLGSLLAQDATRFIAYGVDHVRTLLAARPNEAHALNGHLDAVENGLVGLLGARPFVEPLVVLSGGFAPVRALYERTAREHFERCRAAGLGERRARSPLTQFLGLLADGGDER